MERRLQKRHELQFQTDYQIEGHPKTYQDAFLRGKTQTILRIGQLPD